MRRPLGIVLLFLLGAGVAGAAEREAEIWLLDVHLGQTWIDNFFLRSAQRSRETITDANVGLHYSRIEGSSSLGASGWLGARRYNRFGDLSGPQFGVGASAVLAPDPRARLRLAGSYAKGLNLTPLLSAVIGLPLTDLQAGSASAAFSYRLTPDTSADVSLDAIGIRYRADLLFDTSELFADSFVPAGPSPGADVSGADVNPPVVVEPGLLALSLLASEGIETQRLDFASWRAHGGVSHDFSPRTRLTFGGGYRRSYEEPNRFRQGDQQEGQVALRQLLDGTANVSLSYTYQERRSRTEDRTHALTAQLDKALGPKVRLVTSLGASHLGGPTDRSSSWALIGTAGVSVRLERTSFSAQYARSRYQGFIAGRSLITNLVHARLAHAMSRNVSISTFGYYRNARDELARQYSYGVTVLGASFGVRVKRRTTAGAWYAFQRFDLGGARPTDRSVINAYVNYARALR